MRLISKTEINDDILGGHFWQCTFNFRGLPLENSLVPFDAGATDEAILAYANSAQYRIAAIQKWKRDEASHFQMFNGTVFVSYDTDGNLTCVGFNVYQGDGNAYLTKHMAFIPAKDILLHPEKYIVMLDETDQPDLYAR